MTYEIKVQEFLIDNERLNEENQQLIEKDSVLKDAFERGCEEKRRLEDEYKECLKNIRI